MSDFLDKMATSSGDRASMLPSTWHPDQLDRPVVPLELGAFDVIAEIKDHSPAEGRLSSESADRGARALDYAEGGAAAISVLTEPFRFAGEIAHLEDVVAALAGRDVPVMRKDFLVDTKQVLEARASGASGVLLIAAILDDQRLADMLACAREHSLFVLLESFGKDDLSRSTRLLEQPVYADAAAERKLLIGVNSRNLRTLEVDPTRLERFAAALPDDAVAVAESGLNTPEDAARVAGQGYSMALIGSALMRSDTPGRLVAEMLAAGRGSVPA